MKSVTRTLISIMAIFVLVIFSSCDKDSDSPKHYVYIMNNDAGPNSILVYMQQSDGTLTYQSTATSGGNGSGAGLGSQGSIVIDAAHEYLYTVNAGSNSVSSFRIDGNGNLTLANTVSSSGTLPISVTVYGNWLYVVNSTTSNISGYTISSGGTMTSIVGSNLVLSTATAGPGQISFTPSGQKLVVSEKGTNRITTYTVNASGLAGSMSSRASVGQTPFGFDFSGSNYAIVSEAAGGAANASTVSSYAVGGATTTLVQGPVTASQTAACWVDVTADGKFAFVANAGSNTISTFAVNSSGMLQLVNAAAATGGMGAVDLTLSGDESYLYNISSGSHTIAEFKKDSNGVLTKIGEVTGLPVRAIGIAAF
jgi:6-phosphogluconolactonase